MNLPGELFELPIVSSPAVDVERLPRWLKRNIPKGNADHFTARLIEELHLETVCESAKCPNRMECWSQRTATFMILGNVCTRPCGFCSVPKGKTEALSADEPERVAEAAERLGLKHVVITSVTRDDLPDGGAEHFYRSVLAVRERTGAAVEVLTPDFIGKPGAIGARCRGGTRRIQPQHGNRSPLVPPGARSQKRLPLDARIARAGEASQPGHQNQKRVDARPGRDARRSASTRSPIYAMHGSTF